MPSRALRSGLVTRANPRCFRQRFRMSYTDVLARSPRRAHVWQRSRTSRRASITATLLPDIPTFPIRTHIRHSDHTDPWRIHVNVQTHVEGVYMSTARDDDIGSLAVAALAWPTEFLQF